MRRPAPRPASRALLGLVLLTAGSLLTPGTASLRAQQPLTLSVQVDRPGAKLDPIFYGLMTEEINFAYDGGLYAELIRNRTFRDNAQTPVNWSVVNDGGGEGAIALENAPVPNTRSGRRSPLMSAIAGDDHTTSFM